jgi:NDP-4-keto-2,6-dideoxyhexose 3-C-methyltransferase
MYKEINTCRICGNTNLTGVVNLGSQYLTGVFLKEREQIITSGPLALVKCHDSGGRDVCGLLQLTHSYDLKELYGDNYGYRSGLNKSMVDHLHRKIQRILSMVPLQKDDLIIDIGSNDSTSLQAYPTDKYKLLGIDPTGIKFQEFYPSHIKLIPDFFSSGIIRQHFGEQRAKVVTSFSMFYDLEQPLKFMQEVFDVLADDGIWVFEQSYMPTMLETRSFDTICQEHLEYYGLSQIKWMTDRIGFRVIDVELNDINGGSFSVTVSKQNSQYAVAEDLNELLQQEYKRGLATLQPYREFAEQIRLVKDDLLKFLHRAKQDGKMVMGLGASTKGNVILQYCGMTEQDLSCIGDVNTDKFGCYTPGTKIPIVPEREVLAQNPDYLLVLPWHFKDFFLSCNHLRGRNLVFPLPKLEIVKV